MKRLCLLLLVAICFVACSDAPEAEPISPPETSETVPNTPPTVEPIAEPAEAEHEHVDGEHEHEHEHEDTHTHVGEVNLNYFFEGALVDEVATVECTLSDGTVTLCYEITIAGTPANHEIGPFCPETTDTSAEDAGIWFDGNALYDVDGAFILGLAELYNDSTWRLYNDDGSVNITDTPEAFDAAARPNVDPAYQNHCVAGQMEWLDNGEPVQTTVTIPIIPVPAETPSSGGNWGITLNGVIIAAAAPVDAILGAYTIAVFDDCGGHINPVDGYHLHGARGCSENGEAEAGETPIFAYALDGYPIHSALSAGEAAIVNLDECNGHQTESLDYHYHANPAEENSVINCFKGLTVADSGGDSDAGGGPPADGNGAPPAGGQGGGRLDLAAAAAQLGIAEQTLLDALGGPPPDIAAAAITLGISEEALMDALGGGQPPEGGGRPPGGGNGGQGGG